MEKKIIQTFLCENETQLPLVANEILKTLRTPVAVILSGPVGAGKTTFSKCFARLISIDEVEAVLSPTYSIINELDDFVHADFFRIKTSSEIIHLEIPLYVEGKKYFFVEWGMDWIEEIKKELDQAFSLYEIEIELDQNPKFDGTLRKFHLYQLS